MCSSNPLQKSRDQYQNAQQLLRAHCQAGSNTPSSPPGSRTSARRVGMPLRGGGPSYGGPLATVGKAGQEEVTVAAQTPWREKGVDET